MMAMLQSSPLESLPTEILVLVLSAVARSPSDLGSLIRTCSTIHTCFESFKVCILTAPALQDLGPAIIEAIALSCVEPLTFTTRRDPEDLRNENAVRNYMRQYHQLLASPPVKRESFQDGRCLEWIAREITPQMAGSILRLNIAVQFFADVYLATRLGSLQNRISLLKQEMEQLAPYDSKAGAQKPGVIKSKDVALASELTMLQALRSSMMSPRGKDTRSNQISMYCETLSTQERKRLSQAFLRVQFLVTLAGLNDQMLRRYHASPDERVINPLHQGSHGHPTGAVISELVARVMSLYNPWELEQISQAHYFGFSLMTCVNSADDWSKPKWAPKGNGLIAMMKRMLWRDRYAELTMRSQFDLVGFRRRLLKGGAEVCLGRDGCLQARGFDSVRVAAPSGQGASSDKEPPARPEEGQGMQCSYEPLHVPSPTDMDFYEMKDLESKLLGLPVSGEYHGRKMRTILDECDHGDGMLPTFGPGPGSPQNVHPLECHIALRLMLLKGSGRSNGTCMVTERTNIQWLCASHRFERGRSGWPPPGKPVIGPGPGRGQGSEESMISDEIGLGTVKKPSLLPEPYAWADALDGLSWDRWGMDFLPVSPEYQEIDDPDEATRAPWNPRMGEVEYRFSRWRYLGLVFWDEGRVRDIRTALGDYHTGWLNRVWDE